jgi:hypothetical protein
MHIARHVSQQRRKIELLSRDRKFVGFQLTKFAQLAHDGADSLAGSFRLLQHFFLFVCQRTAMLFEHHPEVSAHHGDRGAKLMHGQ